jgi:hypothetical protein
LKRYKLYTPFIHKEKPMATSTKSKAKSTVIPALIPPLATAVKKPAAAKKKSVASAPAKPASKPMAKPALKAAAKPKAVKPAKSKKPKLVRDSFTIPKAEYTVLDDLKQRAARLARPAKKSELLRAGIKALAAMTDATYVAALGAVPAIKTGRPSKS